MNKDQDLSEILLEVLSNTNKYLDEIFVICLDGEVLGDDKKLSNVAKDIALLKQNGIHSIIVHGEGKILDKLLNQYGATVKYFSDFRLNDLKNIDLIEMILSGHINKKIVSLINDCGGSAIGISAKDVNLVEAKKAKTVIARKADKVDQIVDLGFYGEPTIINPDFLLSMEDTEFIPVISPIARGEDGETLQIDHYMFASLVAITFAANKLIFLTDSEGVYDKENHLLPQLSQTSLANILSANYLTPELSCISEIAIESLEHFVETVNILSAKRPHSLLLELFSDEKTGTVVVAG
jgi:acetylglutamate kinase